MYLNLVTNHFITLFSDFSYLVLFAKTMNYLEVWIRSREGVFYDQSITIKNMTF